MRDGGLVLAYHGCDREVGERLLNGEVFKTSTNGYDWLGDGIYLWERNPKRAFDWAKFMASHTKFKGRVKVPFAVGAIIDLRNCLDLTESISLEALKSAYEGLYDAHVRAKESEFPRNEPANGTDEDLIKRNLDCAVVNYLHRARHELKLAPYDTVRGAFQEGGPLYPGAMIREKTHIQIAVRNTECIRGVFRINGETMG